jgi:hypothetical protein
MADLYDELEFPPKAEYLDQYKNYQVDIAHWKQLAEKFQRVFRKVYARRDAAVLLVYGPQGSGKSMFRARLDRDYRRTSDEGATRPDLRDNLWHALVATDRPEEDTIRETTRETELQSVDDRKGDAWLESLKSFAVGNKSRVRLWLCDDAHKDSMVRPWTGLSVKDFYEARQHGPDALLGLLAERLNDACRHEFQRSIFVMLSNDKAWVEGLRNHLGRWYKELVTELTLPIPEPPTLERIIRTNTNRLNRVSYWYCLDAAQAERRKEVRRALTDGGGFTESFHAVSDSLDGRSRRQGRPGNPNVLTLVTLGSEFAAVKSFLDDREIAATEAHHGPSPRHLGLWDVRGQWASRVVRRPDGDFFRRARMLESEFMLRWVNLSMTATGALLRPPADNDLGSRLLSFILQRPSIGTPLEQKAEWRATCQELDDQVDAAPPLGNFAKDFKDLGQQRSTRYEPILAARAGMGRYGHGFLAHPTLKPDLIVAGPDTIGYGEYKVCALTASASDDDGDIADALRRTGHSIEFTSFLRENLEGLEEYLRDKIERYAAMLESV